MNKKSWLLFALFTFSGMSVLAHALWIKTDGTAKKGEKHSVEVVWAEDSKTEIMQPGKWFSDMQNFELYVTAPDGTKKQIQVTADSSGFTGYFTPDEDGAYMLTVAHTAKDMGGTNKLEYNASALVTVGKTNADVKIPETDNELKLTAPLKNSYTAGKTIKLSYLFKGKPQDKIEVQVFSPSGWNKTFETDATGSIELPLLWSGSYAVEALYHAEDETGTYNDKTYKGVWRCMTYIFDADK